MPPLSPEADTPPVMTRDPVKCSGKEEVVDPRPRIQTEPLAPEGLQIADDELRETTDADTPPVMTRDPVKFASIEEVVEPQGRIQTEPLAPEGLQIADDELRQTYEADTLPVMTRDLVKCASIEEVVEPQDRIQTEPLDPEGLQIAEDELRETPEANILPATMDPIKCAGGVAGMEEVVDPRYRIQTEPLGPEGLQIAEDELRETPERVQEALDQLRDLLREDDTLNFRDDDDILMIFLRPTKFYPESALELMRRVAQFKEKHLTVLANLNSQSEKQALLHSRVVNVLTDRDQHGRRILVANVGGSWDTSMITSDNLFRLFYLIHLAAILEPETQVRGVVVILDFESLGMRQIAALNPSFSMKLLTFIQDAMPLRLKEVHIVKEPFLFKLVWKLFKPLVKEKLRKRLWMHGSKMESLHKHMDPDFLPADYGGRRPKIDYSSADWYPTLSSIDSHLKEWNEFGLKKEEPLDDNS